jgi:hypothetical protein
MTDEFSQFGGREVPDEFAQFGGQSIAPQQQSDSLLNPQKVGANIGTRLWGDVMAGGAAFGQGIHNAPYYLQKAQENIGLAPKGTAESLMPQPTNIDTSSLFGVKNPTLMDKLAQSIVQYIPAAMTGGTSAFSQMAPGAVFGATQSENPIFGAAIPAAVGLGGMAVKPIASSLAKIPDYLSSSKTIDALRNALSPNSIASIENQGSSLYEPIMQKAGNLNIIDNPSESAYLSEIQNNPLTTKSAATKLTTKQFLDDPTFNNAHRLQDALGDRIREFNIMEQRGGALGEEDNNIRQAFIDAIDAVMKDIHSGLNSVDPSLSSDYSAAAKNWAMNVEPWRNAALTLRNLGDPSNVSMEKIVNKFSNMQAKATPISSNAPINTNPVPSQIQPFLDSLSDAIKGKKALKKLGISVVGAGALGGIGSGVHTIKSLL